MANHTTAAERYNARMDRIFAKAKRLKEEAKKSFKLDIKTGGAAFDPDPMPEIARILRELADKLEREGANGYCQSLFDVNGNVVGTFESILS